MSNPSPLAGQRLLILGGSSGIGLTVAAAARQLGAEIILAGRDSRRIRAAAEARGIALTETEGAPLPDGITIETADLGDEASLAGLAERAGRVDGLISLGSAPANGPLESLLRADVHAAFDAKVIGPLMLLKHLELSPAATVVLFSGFVAWRPSPGLAVMAAANAAVSALADALAVELAPRRAVAISPGIVDSGAWDGPDRDAFLQRTAAGLPAGRVGAVEDVAAAVLYALTNPFVTATTLHVDGGARVS